MGEEKMIREETMRYLIEGERLSYENTLKRVVIAFSLIILVLLGILFYIVTSFDVEMVDVEQDGKGVNIIGDSNGVDYNGTESTDSEADA